MMPLSVQIISLFISFICGFVFCFFIIIFDKYICKLKKFFQFLVCITYIILFTLIYFQFLIVYNNGIIHPYFIIAILLGYLFASILIKYFKRIVLFLKK